MSSEAAYIRSGPGTENDVWAVDHVMSQADSENFSVASILLGRKLRRHLLSIYGYARLVDDVGDEAEGDRLTQLDRLEAEVRRVYGGTPRHPLLRRLQGTVHELGVPARPLLDLIAANRQDQTVTSYATFADLVGYCRLSANPVGELVLYAIGEHTDENVALSNDICTALQVVEHLQDVAEDRAKGRVYLPLEDLERFGCAITDLVKNATPERLKKLILFETWRARRLLDSGAPLISRLSGRARLAVAGFVGGGRAAADALIAAGGDVLAGCPGPSKTARVRHSITALVAGR